MIYENLIQDPDFDPANPGNCFESMDSNIEPCYSLWIGRVKTTTPITIFGDPNTTANVSFNPNDWDVAWANGNSPPISVKISNIEGHTVYNEGDFSSIILKGPNGSAEVGIIPGSKRSTDTALYVQFDRREAVMSLGSITPGTVIPVTVQGRIGTDIFSGTSDINIVANTGTEVNYLTLHKVGCSTYPGSTKESRVGDTIYVYDMSPGSCVAGIGTNYKYWEAIVDGKDDIGPCPALDSQETFALGEAIFALPEGAFLMIAKSDVPGDLPSPPHSNYVGRQVVVTPGVDDQQNFQVIQKCDGKTVGAKCKRFPGSELLVIEPEYVEWSSDTELYPIVFDSVGDWTVSTSVTPPEGFVADNESLSAEVANEVEAVQFTITDIGSKYLPTKVTHKIKEKKHKEITYTSEIGIKLTPELAQEKGTGIWGDDQGEDNDDQGQNDDDQVKGKKKK